MPGTWHRLSNSLLILLPIALEKTLHLWAVGGKTERIKRINIGLDQVMRGEKEQSIIPSSRSRVNFQVV